MDPRDQLRTLTKLGGRYLYILRWSQHCKVERRQASSRPFKPTKDPVKEEREGRKKGDRKGQERSFWSWKYKLDIIRHACNASTQEVKQYGGGCLKTSLGCTACSRSVWDTRRKKEIEWARERMTQTQIQSIEESIRQVSIVFQVCNLTTVRFKGREKGGDHS